MNINFLVLFAVVSLTIYNYLFKLTTAKIAIFYAIPFIGIGVLITGILNFIYNKNYNFSSADLTHHGVLLAILTGAAWAIGILFVFLMYSKNIQLSTGLPIITIGLTILGCLTGFMLLREPVTVNKFIGLSLMMFGFIFINKI